MIIVLRVTESTSASETGNEVEKTHSVVAVNQDQQMKELHPVTTLASVIFVSPYPDIVGGLLALIIQHCTSIFTSYIYLFFR